MGSRSRSPKQCREPHNQNPKPDQNSKLQYVFDDCTSMTDEAYHSNPSSTHNSTQFTSFIPSFYPETSSFTSLTRPVPGLVEESWFLEPKPSFEVEDSHKNSASMVYEACLPEFNPRPRKKIFEHIKTPPPTNRTHHSSPAIGYQPEPDDSIDEGYGGSVPSSRIPSSRGPSRVEQIPRRSCPIDACVKDYQRKGNFVRHFVSKHGKLSPGNNTECDILMLRHNFHVLTCNGCKPAMLEDVATFANHIWTHMPEIKDTFERSRPNSSVPSTLFSPRTNEPHFFLDSGISRMSSALSSEKQSQPVSTVANIPNSPNNTSEQSLKTSSTPQEASHVDFQVQTAQKKSSLTLTTSKHEENQTISLANKEPCARGPQQISHWVDATRDGTSDLSEPSSIWSPLTTFPSPVVDEAMASSKALVFELLEILQEGEGDMDTYDALSEAASSPQDPDTSETHGSASEGSSNTNSSSDIVAIVSGIKRSYQPNDGPPNEEDDGEPPKKKPNQKRDPSSVDTPSSKGRCKRIPCTQRDCLGTDEEISLLLRSLMHHHKIVICPDCCTRLTIKDGEKSEEVWKSHKTEQCERQCISRACSGIADDAPRPHRRTTNCVSWRALGDEEKWAFIYTLANPGQTPPTPDISEGAGLRHSRERILRQPRKQARGTEIVEALAKSIEAKDRRILELESDLTAANARNTQLQQGRDDQRTDQEYIIWTLMERLTDKNISIPASIQDRLSSHCPRLMKKPEIISMLSRNQVFPPTPSVTPHASQQRRPDDLLFMDNNPNPSNFDYDNLMSDVPYSAGSYNL